MCEKNLPDCLSVIHHHLTLRKKAGAWLIIEVKGHQHQWLAGGYNLEIGLLEVDSMVVTWWIVAFLPSVSQKS